MEKLIVIKTLKEMKALEAYLEDKHIVAYDTETTGLEKDSHIIGVSICAELEPDIGYYVILRSWDVEQQKLLELETLKGMPSLLAILAKRSLVMHNGGFDCYMTQNNFGIDLMPALHTDTMILGHLLNENRSNKLKDRGVELFGETAKLEQTQMKESIAKNGGQSTRANYELYKADSELIARYGAKDAILTLKIFYNDCSSLFEEGLDSFFYDDESMPLFKGPTYDMNTVGLRIDPEKLQKLRGELEAECLQQKAFIYREITPIVQEKYAGTNKKNIFNIGATQQLSWLLFVKLGNEFNTLTKNGKELCKAMNLKLPYNAAAKRTFLAAIKENKGRVWQGEKWNPKTKKMMRPKKIEDAWKYLACGKETIGKLSAKYKWCATLLAYNKNMKLLNTYIIGIQTRQRYNVIQPNFLQHGTTSGRYSCKNPNFQNLPREDKRVKSCIVARPGKIFVGADYAQLEPRVFASTSGDETLQGCFSKGEDFYSVVGAPIFEKTSCSLIKDDKDSFAKLHPKLRDKSKVIALATPYGRTAMQQALAMGITADESQELINRYFEQYPKVELMMLESHEQAKANGVVYNLFGRPRRIPAAKDIKKIYGNTAHSELPYEARTLLNLAMNHRVQSTAASIMNRSAIAVWKRIQANAATNPSWSQVKIVLQVHDELILEGPEVLEKEMISLLKSCMEDTVKLPGVALVAEPKAAKTLADLK